MKPNLVRATLFDTHVSITFLNTTDLCREGRNIHNTSRTASAALGRAMTAAALLGDSLKEDDFRSVLILAGGGPVGRIVAESNNKVHVRADIDHPEVDVPAKENGKLDVGALVGKDGYLRVLKDIGLKEPYIGTVDLVSGEIAEDLTAYYFYSEQIPTAAALGVLVAQDGTILSAGGFLGQLLPGHTEEHIEFLENLAQKFAGGISRVLVDTPDVYEMLRIAAGDHPYEIVSEKEVRYHCPCNVHKIESIILSMGREEIENLIAEGGAEIQCHYCKKAYGFSPDSLRQLLDIQAKL